MSKKKKKNKSRRRKEQDTILDCRYCYSDSCTAAWMDLSECQGEQRKSYGRQPF